MNFDSHKLFDLLPAILRIRDQSLAQVTPGWLDPESRIALADLQAKPSPTPAEKDQLAQLSAAALAGPLASLLAIMAEQIALIEEDLDQLYDDQFIETCAEWLVPYIGDLIGYRPLHGISANVASPRAEVAHAIAYRRRKGTVAVLEQLAHDVTGWDAVAVEFFQHLIVTQYMNHVRRQCLATPELRHWQKLYPIGTAFDQVARTIDVRRIGSRRGRYNIPNVGLFLWRLGAYPLTHSPAVRIDDRRWRFHPLGIDQQLYTLPQTEDDITHLATPLNVPAPIGRRVLDAQLDDYYTGADEVTKSLRIYDDSSGSFKAVDPAAIRVCNLADDGPTWAHLPPAGIYAIDPVLGRVALPPGLAAGTKVQVDFHYAFSADLGGGEYERSASFETAETPTQLIQVPQDHATIQAALDALKALGADGVVEITDSGRYEETLTIDLVANQKVVLRAADKRRPTIVLGGDVTVTGGAASELRLNGLLISRGSLRVPGTAANKLRSLRISHCTLVPGLMLAPDGTPQSPDAASLIAQVTGLDITIERSITGALRVDANAKGVSASDSIIDSTETTKVAYVATDGGSPGAPLSLNACTVIGKLHAQMLPLVTNSILLASLVSGDAWSAPVIAALRQQGCVRFSYVPDTARVPRRYQCLPEAAPSPKLALPRFVSLRYGYPAYAQLATSVGARLQTGADDEGQPGAFHSLYQPQRESNLRVRLQEYLRTSLEAGILYAS